MTRIAATRASPAVAAVAVAASMLLAACAAPLGSDGVVDSEWLETSPGHYTRSPGLGLDALAAAHQEYALFALDLPGMGEVRVHAMPHGRPVVDSWEPSGSGWRRASAVQGYAWGHGQLVGYGYDGGGLGTGRDSSLELVAFPAGWQGVVGVVDGGRERLIRLWIDEADGQPVQRALVESTSCYRESDHTWIYGCGSRPVAEGEVAPMATA